MSAAQLVQRTRRAGYSNDLSQPSVQVTKVIGVAGPIDFSGVDDWLKGVLDLEVSSPPRMAVPPKSDQEAQVAGLVWRAMTLRAGLLQAIRVPVFDPGAILELRPDPSVAGQWQGVLAQPTIEHLQMDPFEPAWEAALKVVTWLIHRPRTPENTEQVFKFLNKQIIRRFPPPLNGGESTIAVLREAWNLGIEFRHLGRGTYQLGLGSKQLRVDRGANQLDSAIGCAIARNKHRSAALLRDAGLPAPIHLLATSEETALAAAHRLGWPVVVKPVDRDRGEGVSVNIRSAEALSTAFRKAIALSTAVLVEAQVEGVCHRVLVAQGQVRMVARRLPKSVKGDGIQTVRDLVAQANAEENARPPWTRLKPFPIDPLAISSLAAVGLTLDSVPAPGVIAPLRPIQTSEWGGVAESFTDRIHPDNLEIAVRAARLFGLSVAGIDIISTDITQSWRVTRSIINEVNYSPLLSGRSTGPAISAMIDGLVTDQGRIPIDVVLGDGAALAEGEKIRSAYSERGVRCWLVSDSAVMNETGATVHLAARGLYEQCLAVLMDSQVEALVMVVQSDELVRTGLPTGRIDRLHDLFKNPSPAQEHPLQDTASPPWADGVRRLLHAHGVPGTLNETGPCSRPPPA